MTLPILYSFRRCPYAMRARMALHTAGIELEHREVLLKDKPAQMLSISPKGTVPVLLLPDGEVFEESMDIMHWALQTSDPHNWLGGKSSGEALQGEDSNAQLSEQMAAQIADFEARFKPNLDAYKYSSRQSDAGENAERLNARDNCEHMLRALNKQLAATAFLYGTDARIADVALMPFVRQFAHVDRGWFDSLPYKKVQAWLDHWLASPLLAEVMQKHPRWSDETAPTPNAFR